MESELSFWIHSIIGSGLVSTEIGCDRSWPAHLQCWSKAEGHEGLTCRAISPDCTMMYNVPKDTRQGGELAGMRFESSVHIDAPAERVWALVDKLEEWPQWMPSIKKIERISQGPLTAGSQLSVTAKVSGLTVRLLMTVTSFVAERNVVLEGKTLGTKLARFYILEPVNGKTRLTVGGDVSGALARLARRGGQKISTEIALAVKTKIEGSE